QSSKFWGADSDSSEEVSDDFSDSSADSSSSSSDSEESFQGASKYLQDDSSDSSEDDRRVIQSAKERRHTELKATVSNVLNHLSSNDWPELVKSFEKLIKHIDKHYAMPEQVSNSVKRALMQVSETVDSAYADKEHRQNLSTSFSKALSALRQRVAKYMKTVSLDTNLTLSSGGDSETDDSTCDSIAKKSEVEVDKKDKNYLLYADKKDVTYEMIDEKLQDITASRGKKSTDRHEVVRHLLYVRTLAKCPAQEVEILLHIISAQFDMSNSMASCMSVATWRNCVVNVLRLLTLLKGNSHIALIEQGEPAVRVDKDTILNGGHVELAGSLCAFVERLDDEYNKSLQNIDPHTQEYMSRLQDECFLLILIDEVIGYYKDLQNAESQVKISLRLLSHIHCKTVLLYEAMRRFAFERLDTKHNHKQVIIDATQEPQISNMDSYYAADGFCFPKGKLHEVVSHLTERVYTIGDQRSKVRAILYDTFHKSVCGDYDTAREQLLMSHLQQSINHMDVDTQVLFNRCMAQIGLNAFQDGAFGTSKACLSDLLASGKARELLAQGISPGRHSVERNLEQEKLERRRQMPFHTHVNVDLLESVFLVSSILTDTHDLFIKNRQPRTSNRSFVRFIEGFERQTFNGPPEGLRDTLMCATKHLIEGNWMAASDYITNMDCWSMLPTSEERRDYVLKLIVSELKREALRTYVFQRAAYYESLCLNTLSAMFGMSVDAIQTTIHKLLAAGLAGSCDPPTTSFAVHLTEPTALHLAVTIFSEKLTVFLDANERSLGVHVETEASPQHDDEESYMKQRSARQSRDDEREDVSKLRNMRFPNVSHSTATCMNVGGDSRKGSNKRYPFTGRSL
ncbi:eukaryotic translation initiation factor 3 subunit 8 N-terminus-domain-containing protein, partial [Ostreococcus tauri]